MVRMTIRWNQSPAVPELLQRIRSMPQNNVPAEMRRTNSRGAYGQGIVLARTSSFLSSRCGDLGDRACQLPASGRSQSIGREGFFPSIHR